MTTPQPPGPHDQEQSLDALLDAVVRQEHVVTTHMAVIEGWLGLLEDGVLPDSQGCRGARVVRERTEALRGDLTTLLRMVKDWTRHTDLPQS
ncbi:hypothetical protein [Tessaracoccus antarcticus]|uniref:Uncharacterized protein n=1 Tax=Tessaracoccus antarcticus TaxID=2479848 RepID=A0A3M0GIA3_9ACTN|nr:hypothetical protein [Tessaracoccus antarcticus]RMB61343.1 hypothetical protein EAX62_01385 [Tessaracoccus antarcticus]